jgi:uncharacterized membrane protein YedE/YeeE
MTTTTKQLLTALASGLLFGVGLIISGMTQPQKVLDFLNPLGQFDASLAFVMVGAIGVHASAYRLIKRRSAPLFAAAFLRPRRSTIDGQLLLGASLFGVGWGLSGYCPGPAVVSLSTSGAAVVFVGMVIVGTYLASKVESAHERREPMLIAASEPTENV